MAQDKWSNANANAERPMAAAGTARKNAMQNLLAWRCYF